MSASTTTSFFNYHEYKQVDSFQQTDLITTHFPNVYETIDGPQLTRVVRVPRVASVDYPQFSTLIPGTEEGALLPTKQANYGSTDRKMVFEPMKQLKGQWYSDNSISPLTLYLNQIQFERIIDQVNKYLETQYKSNTFWIIYMLFDLLTFGLFGFLRIGKKPADHLERYVTNLNSSFEKEGIPIQLISPRLSGYLSLDFVIPKPQGPTN